MRKWENNVGIGVDAITIGVLFFSLCKLIYLVFLLSRLFSNLSLSPSLGVLESKEYVSGAPIVYVGAEISTVVIASLL